MNLSALIQAARLSLPLVPSAQRPLAEILLTEADRINKEYELLKAHVGDMTHALQSLRVQVDHQSAAINALMGKKH